MPILSGYPGLVSYESTQEIIHQMENCICKIKVENGQGTGFFCKIPFPDKFKFLTVLITNNHIIGEELLHQENAKIYYEIKQETTIKEISLNNRMKYTNRELDITILEIKENDGITTYLELDDNIIEDIFKESNINKEYMYNSIYAIQYPQGKLSVSYGVLKQLSEEDRPFLFAHKCSTTAGSAGSPILNIYNNKVIGVHHSGIMNNKLGRGTFLDYPIKDFIKMNKIHRNEELLKEFNNKYNFNIKDDKIVKLDLRWKKLGNNGLEDLCKIEFKELKELILNNNNIEDIKPLEKAKFQKLEILDLSQNKISDINIFEKVTFKGIKQLYLGYNNISDIKIFERVNFEKLEILLLNDNKIDKTKDNLIISNLKSKIENFEI